MTGLDKVGWIADLVKLFSRRNPMFPVLGIKPTVFYPPIYFFQCPVDTRFKDGSILLTKSFGGTTKYGSNVILQRLCDASVRDVWMEHRNRVQQLEADGKQAEAEISFATFYQIWAEA